MRYPPKRRKRDPIVATSHLVKCTLEKILGLSEEYGRDPSEFTALMGNGDASSRRSAHRLIMRKLGFNEKQLSQMQRSVTRLTRDAENSHIEAFRRTPQMHTVCPQLSQFDASTPTGAVVYGKLNQAAASDPRNPELAVLSELVQMGGAESYDRLMKSDPAKARLVAEYQEDSERRANEKSVVPRSVTVTTEDGDLVEVDPFTVPMDEVRKMGEGKLKRPSSAKKLEPIPEFVADLTQDSPLSELIADPDLDESDVRTVAAESDINELREAINARLGDECHNDPAGIGVSETAPRANPTRPKVVS